SAIGASTSRLHSTTTTLQRTVATMPQDMPPTGGYEPVQYRRNLPVRGFRPAWYLVAVAGIMTYGFYRVGQGIREQNELAREKMWSRIHLIPLLQAEEDRDVVRRVLGQKKMEKELLGKEVPVYNKDTFERPTFAVTPSNVTK
ncbi:NADH dehydrogenase [ubiquinone] 1 alpha subcomplex subunit 13, partial [Pseudocercospora fuligena]